MRRRSLPATLATLATLAALAVAALIAAVGCRGESEAETPPCERALQRSAELTVARAAPKRGLADADKHVEQIARAMSPSFLARCTDLSQLARDAYVACVLVAETAGQAAHCHRKRTTETETGTTTRKTPR